MYNLENSKVKIVDMDYFVSVTNKVTGETVTAKNHNGRVNHKMYYAMNYNNKIKGLAHIECGKANAISFALKQLGLPTYRTLKKSA